VQGHPKRGQGCRGTHKGRQGCRGTHREGRGAGAPTGRAGVQVHPQGGQGCRGTHKGAEVRGYPPEARGMNIQMGQGPQKHVDVGT
jgi:hypothetical protein